MYLTNSLSDGKVDEKKHSKKMMFFWALVIVGIGTATSLIILGYGLAGYWEDDFVGTTVPIPELVDNQDQKLQCARWLQIADTLVRKYDNNKDVTQWSETDRERVMEIEGLYQENCIPTEENIMSDLKKCTIIYITIESLIDKMKDRKLNTLTANEQKAYNTNYEKYFDTYCNKIKDEIEQTSEFIQFNKTRLQ